jgi:hypothetical protein
MTAVSDWDIKGPSRACARSGREFVEGEIVYTLLYRDGAGFRREDLCEEAWEARNENRSPFSFWKWKFEPPPQPKPEALKKDDAEGLLRQMLKSGNSAYHNAQYILAIMLERKRVLKPLPSDDRNILVYEHAKTGEVFVLPDPHLSFEQIPAVQREVSELLKSGLSE